MEKFPSDQTLKETYVDIEQKAVEKITDGKVIGNSLLTGTLLERLAKESRYALSTLGLIYGSPAHNFLQLAIKKIEDVEPNIQFQEPDLLHLTLGEVVFNEAGKSASGINSSLALKYHQALRQNLPDHPNPIKLKLDKVFPTLDPSEKDTSTASVVAAFITGDDPTIFTIRNEIRESVEQASLNPSARLGHIRVVFVTLGRFIDKPTLNGQTIPVLDALQQVNSNIGTDVTAEINALQLISTASSYTYSAGHVFLDPPIDFRKADRKNSPLVFLKPGQKLELLTQPH